MQPSIGGDAALTTWRKKGRKSGETKSGIIRSFSLILPFYSWRMSQQLCYGVLTGLSCGKCIVIHPYFWRILFSKIAFTSACLKLTVVENNAGSNECCKVVLSGRCSNDFLLCYTHKTRDFYFFSTWCHDGVSVNKTVSNHISLFGATTWPHCC